MENEKLLFCGKSIIRVLQNSSIVVDEFCTGYIAINKSAAAAEVDGIPLAQDQSFTFGCNRGEIFFGRIDITFPGAGTGIVFIIQKLYNPSLTKNPPVEL